MVTNFITLILLLSLNSLAFAQSTGYIDLNQLIKPDSDSYNDIGYIQLVPQYEENPDPKKQMTIEFFHGAIDDTPESKLRLEHIKNILSDDARLDPKFKSEVIAVSNRINSLKHSRQFHDFLEHTGMQNSKVHYEQLPGFLDYNAKIKTKVKSKRLPSSIKSSLLSLEEKMGRKSWTLVRMSSSMAGSFAALYFSEGLSPIVATSLAFWPGLASGGIAYYSNAFGSFLTSGKWAKWLVDSDNYFSKKITKALGLSEKNLIESIRQNDKHFSQKYPEFKKNNPELFDSAIKKISKSRVKNYIKNNLKVFEEYFKWWVTEITFVGTAIKLPLAVAGLNPSTSLLGMTGDVLLGSTMGMIAQGPGDIAIQVRKYQKIEELKQEVLKGSTKFDNEKELLAEIEKVLTKEGPNASYVINDSSHAALRRIESWAQGRATFLSFFSVMGVGAEIAGIPLARPLLIGVGVAGAVYYSSVKGWLKPKKIKDTVKNYIQKYKDGKVLGPMRFLQNRYCSNPFIQTKPNFLN